MSLDAKLLYLLSFHALLMKIKGAIIANRFYWEGMR